MKPPQLFNQAFEVEFTTKDNLHLRRSFLITFETMRIPKDPSGQVEKWSLFGGRRQFRRSADDALIFETTVEDNGVNYPRLRLSFADPKVADIILMIPGLSWTLIGIDEELESLWDQYAEIYSLKKVRRP